MSGHSLRVYHYEPRITTLGPGLRCGLWLQGCSIGCLGCLVPDSHDENGGEAVAVSELSGRILEEFQMEGVTISGGEPFQQNQGLLSMLRQLREGRSEFSIMLYSGHTRRALERDAVNREILALADILVAGPFRHHQAQPDGWRGSANQCIHFLSDRHGEKEIPPVSGHLEFLLRPGAGLFMAGIPPRTLWSCLMRRLAGDEEHEARRSIP